MILIDELDAPLEAPVQLAGRVRPYGKRVEECEGNPYGLSNLQVQTIQLVTNGYDQAAIARLCKVSVGAVKERLGNIRAKMDCDTTLEAACMWIREVEFGEAEAA